MSTLAEDYIRHIGGIFDLLVQNKELDFSRLPLDFSRLPLDFVDASTPQYIQKVDTSLQQVVLKMISMEQELASHRKYPKTANTLVTDIKLASPMVAHPADAPSLPASPSSRSLADSWEFISDTSTHTTVPVHPPQQEPGSCTSFPGTTDLTLAQAAHSIEAMDSATTAIPAMTTTAATTSAGAVPCAECIQKCAFVATSVVTGDLRVRIACHNSECQQSILIDSINQMVAKLSMFADEVLRVIAQDAEGNLGIQAKLEGECGTWKEVLQHLNSMTDEHSKQVRDIATVCTAVAHGDLSQKITVDVKGEMLLLKETVNKMVEQLRSFSSEVTRVTHEVGTEGKFGGQAIVEDLSGTWKELTDNVNTMAFNLTGQVRDIATVCKAVACGDLTKKVSVPAEGETLELKETMNTMVDQLRTFAAEVTRVAIEVGIYGKLGGEAEVRGVDGTWKDIIDNVNTMNTNLTAQVRDIADVSNAIAKGNFDKKVTVNVRGEMMDLKQTINTMVDLLQDFATEVSRVSVELGSEGKLGGCADVRDARGTWKDITDHFNDMACNLTIQVRCIAEVTTAIALGDLSKTVGVEAQGEISELKVTINSMVEQLRTFAAEVTRIAREVGAEGKLGGQAYVKGVDGTWKELTDNVNTMAANLTFQVRDIANVSEAIAKGDLSKKITVDVKGEMMDLKHTINAMVDQFQEFATEVTRVSYEVGTEGKFGGQAHIEDIGGTWKELADNVNTMASGLTTQVRSIAEVATALADGDLSKTIDVETQGEVSAIKENVNSTVKQLRQLAAEVTRIAREVGTDGKFGGQAYVKQFNGTWKEVAENVNTMAVNLTAQVRDIADISKALAKGDFSKKVSVNVKGEMMDFKQTINAMVDHLEQFATEINRISLEVGTEGKLGGQAVVQDASGTWKELTDNVNTMAANLTTQVRSVAGVATAVAAGDLSKTLDVQAQGEMSELKIAVNFMVEHLRIFATEVTRVAREAGTEGRLGGQAYIKGVDGYWKELTDTVNTMAANLTAQVRDIANVSKAVAMGDLSKKVTVDAKGDMMDLKHTVNTMVDQLQEFVTEVNRVSLEVGTEGKLGGQAAVEDVYGTWKELADNVNTMAANLTTQVRSVAGVATAVAAGDLSKTLDVQAQGEMSELKTTVNFMVEHLRAFATEVTRVAREVGTQGRLGGQAKVEGVDGTWKELTDNVNTLAANLTCQVRSIAEVTTAVAAGDLAKTIEVEVQGEISELKNTVNSMVEQLRIFATEVTRVTREVGIEGRLGGQAHVKGVDGYWKELTDNVNTMTANLTAQVRDIADVSKAVVKGDLSKKVTVNVKGEMMDLKCIINAMVDQLQEFATEVNRVSLEVGTEGKLGGQAVVQDVSGTWKELTDNVNTMAANLTTQVRSVAGVATAVAAGDLSKTLDVQAQGEMSELKTTVNSMVEQLRTLAAEVTRVAREVSTEGRLGGQATVEGAHGTWKEMTDHFNSMAIHLTAHARSITEVASAVASGDLTKTVDLESKGELTKLQNTVNGVVEQLRAFSHEVARATREVGIEGRLQHPTYDGQLDGTWKELTNNVNTMATNLTAQMTGDDLKDSKQDH